jgi:GDPmannose 4,6-dehydratase
MKNKKVLITGITGQDGSYLAELLLKKKYIVHGIIRRSSLIKTDRIDHLIANNLYKKSFFLHYGDLVDSLNLFSLIKKISPAIIFNLGAQSHVKVSFETPEYTANTDALGTLRILEAIKTLGLTKKTRFYQASTSEMYGNSKILPITDKTTFTPVSPYGVSKLFSFWMTKNYREAYKMHASNGILFNHESPRRGETFVSRKITKAVAEIYLKKRNFFLIGNLESKRDWGHAKEYVEGMYKIVMKKTASDYILSTGKSYTVKYFIEKSFKNVGINIIWKGKGINAVGYNKKNNQVLVKVSSRLFRPLEINNLIAVSKRTENLLGWRAKTSIDQLIKEMIDEDIKKLS